MSTIEKISTSPVTFQDLVKFFPGDGVLEGSFAVDHLSLNIEPGELVTLLGPSGCGKTTTLRMLAGFEYPTEGKIYIGNRDVTTSPANKRDAAMVFQSYALFPHLSIYENVAYGLHVQKTPKKELHQRVQNILKLMHLEDMANRSPSQISGGQQQRVALARAIVTEPKVLLFDEPLSNLDAKLRVYMRSELRKLQQRLSITSIYVTHDQEEAMAISDKIVIMNKGKIEQVGSPLEIYTKPTSHFVANFMGKANFVIGIIRDKTNNSLQVQVENTVLEIERDENVNVEKGEQVHCMIRPEFWRIDINGELHGEITEVTYFGSYVEYEIKIGEQLIHMEDYDHLINGILSVNDPVQLSLKSNFIRVLPLEETTD